MSSTEHDQTPNYDSSSYLVRRLFREHISKYKWRLAIAITCMIIVGAATASMSYVIEHVIDEVFVNQNEDLLIVIVGVVLTVFMVKSLASFGQSYFLVYVTQCSIADIQKRLYRHLMFADIAMIASESSGRIVSRFSNDFNILRASINIITINFAREFFTLIFLVAVMLYQSSFLGMIAFSIFPVAIYPIFRIGKRMRKISNRTQQELGHFTETLAETLHNAPVIKSYQLENVQTKRGEKALDGVVTHYLKAAQNYAMISPIMEMLSGLGIAAVIWYGGWQVFNGETTPGKFMSFITAALLAYKPLKSLSTLNATIQEGLAAAKRVFLLLDEKPAIRDADNAQSPDMNQVELSFNRVSFDYSASKPALKNLSFQVKQGQTVALVGPSGGGKSTVMRLMMRFYDPHEGYVMVNGVDLRDIKIEHLRSHIAFVSQDITLFDDTVAANIAYGKPGATMDAIKAAAEDAAAAEFIEQLPQGYDTPIGEKGASLSGGQRQRIAIARAILRDAPLLLLDEATSALDNVSEHKIQEALKRLMRNRTTIVIAHRLSTIDDADCIFVISNGQVVEQGTHSELLVQEGHYTTLYRGFDS